MSPRGCGCRDIYEYYNIYKSYFTAYYKGEREREFIVGRLTHIKKSHLTLTSMWFSISASALKAFVVFFRVRKNYNYYLLPTYLHILDACEREQAPNSESVSDSIVILSRQ
jgi:hypothetical protein